SPGPMGDLGSQVCALHWPLPRGRGCLLCRLDRGGAALARPGEARFCRARMRGERGGHFGWAAGCRLLRPAIVRPDTTAVMGDGACGIVCLDGNNRRPRLDHWTCGDAIERTPQAMAFVPCAHCCWRWPDSQR